MAHDACAVLPLRLMPNGHGNGPCPCRVCLPFTDYGLFDPKQLQFLSPMCVDVAVFTDPGKICPPFSKIGEARTSPRKRHFVSNLKLRLDVNQKCAETARPCVRDMRAIVDLIKRGDIALCACVCFICLVCIGKHQQRNG